MIEEKCLKFSNVYNCVYRLRCNVYNLLYIGQISTPLNKRFNNHKSDIRNLNFKNEDQEFEIAHFAYHGIQNIRISILNIVPNKLQRNDDKIWYGSVWTECYV